MKYYIFSVTSTAEYTRVVVITGYITPDCSLLLELYFCKSWINQIQGERSLCLWTGDFQF